MEASLEQDCATLFGAPQGSALSITAPYLALLLRSTAERYRNRCPLVFVTCAHGGEGDCSASTGSRSRIYSIDVSGNICTQLESIFSLQDVSICILAQGSKEIRTPHEEVLAVSPSCRVFTLPHSELCRFHTSAYYAALALTAGGDETCFLCGSVPRALETARSLPAEIVPAMLYLGDGTHGRSATLLEGLGIGAVVNATGDSHREALPSCFRYLWINVPDRPSVDLARHFDECFEFIRDCEKSGLKVLVHCEEGKSRSVTLAVMYLMRAFKLSLSSAFTMVYLRRSQANPNNGFMRQLCALDEELSRSCPVPPAWVEDDYGSGGITIAGEALRPFLSKQ